jgi:hypothetical protein
MQTLMQTLASQLSTTLVQTLASQLLSTLIQTLASQLSSTLMQTLAISNSTVQTYLILGAEIKLINRRREMFR